jgi:anti-sigma B factor antagonist
MDMKVDRLPDEVTRIALTGSLDVKGTGQVEAPFAAVASKNSRVVVDCAGLEFLASIGIRMLVFAAKTVSRRGGVFVLCNVGGTVGRVLETAGMGGVLPQYPSLDAAISAVKAGATA